MKYETAKRMYNKNRKHVSENIKTLPWRELVEIAKQQDRLYLIMCGHEDKRVAG